MKNLLRVELLAQIQAGSSCSPQAPPGIQHRGVLCRDIQENESGLDTAARVGVI